MIEILAVLCIKHFFADYVFNNIPSNKHIYGSIGSIRHVAIHMIGGFLALIGFLPLGIVLLAVFFDGFVHYHEDWLKTKYLYKRKGLSDRHRRAVTGLDQLVHMLTYILIAWAVT